MDNLFIFIAQLLGVRLFKKYWPYNGSFWNYQHINPNNKYDLESVIRNAWEYTRGHVQLLFTELLIVGISAFSGYMTLQQCRGFLPIALIFHGYALMVHHYNRILAGRRLKKIKQTEDRTPKIRLNADDDLIRMEEIGDPAHFYLHYNYQRISPDFAMHSQAAEFRDYLYAKWHYKRSIISEQVFLGQAPKLYIAWRAENI